MKKHISKEDAFDNLLRTMNQLSSENRSLNKKSFFTNGLNNVLLLLMFLETLSAVTLLMTMNINTYPGGQVELGGHGGQILGPGEHDDQENIFEGRLNENVYGGRHTRSLDLLPDTVFVSDLPDIDILPLNKSTRYTNEYNIVSLTNSEKFDNFKYRKFNDRVLKDRTPILNTL